MKRGTIEHPKTAELAAELDIPLLYAAGVLESLWHWTAKYCPRGDIGRYSNRAIASGIHWTGDPDKLAEALVCSKWVDQSDEHRLVVHDWADHCDNYTHDALKLSGQDFANGVAPRDRKPGPKKGLQSSSEDRQEIVGSSSEDRRKIVGSSSLPYLTLPCPAMPKPCLGEGDLERGAGKASEGKAGTVAGWLEANRIDGPLADHVAGTAGMTVEALEAARIKAVQSGKAKNPAAVACHRVCDQLNNPPPKRIANPLASAISEIRQRRRHHA